MIYFKCLAFQSFQNLPSQYAIITAPNAIENDSSKILKTLNLDKAENTTVEIGIATSKQKQNDLSLNNLKFKYYICKPINPKNIKKAPIMKLYTQCDLYNIKQPDMWTNEEQTIKNMKLSLNDNPEISIICKITGEIYNRDAIFRRFASFKKKQYD
ncbi:Hypothetical_protein [Hexamita inflata]|uniref:Hypothetical_protein n=1 Tax=Hexamita inflata TaxID=28002 RepID=A0AA86R4U7_9EUKA|nr:Hypothetical protein HINF_LOCUS53798 [Hexamita inflata]